MNVKRPRGSSKSEPKCLHLSLQGAQAWLHPRVLQGHHDAEELDNKPSPRSIPSDGLLKVFTNRLDSFPLITTASHFKKHNGHFPFDRSVRNDFLALFQLAHATPVRM